MNITEFCSIFPEEEACRQYLEKTICPNCRRCPRCNGQKSWLLAGPTSGKDCLHVLSNRSTHKLFETI